MENFEEFREELRNIYSDYSKRIDTVCWKIFLENDLCVNVDTRELASREVLTFLKENTFIPNSIYKILDSYFSWTNNRHILYKYFSKSYVDKIMENVLNDSKFSYEDLLHCEKGREDEFIRNYYRADGSITSHNLYEAKLLLSTNFKLCHSQRNMLLLKGRFFEEVHKLEEAKDVYFDLYEKYQDDEKFPFYLGKLYLRMGELRLAEEYLSFAYEINPNNHETIAQLGKCYFSMSRFSKAINMYSKLNEPGFEDFEAKMLYNSAVDFYMSESEMRINKKPSDDNLYKYYDALIKKAICRYSNENYTDALNLLKKAVVVGGENVDTLHKIFSCYDKLNDYDNMIKYCEKIVEQKANSKEAYITKSYLAFYDKNYEESVNIAYEGLSIYTDSMSLKNNLVSALGRLDRVEEGIQFYYDIIDKYKSDEDLEYFEEKIRTLS